MKKKYSTSLNKLFDKKLVQSIKKGLASKKTYSQKKADKIIGW